VSETATSPHEPPPESSSISSAPMSRENWQKGITLAALSLAQQESAKE
jgi:hypothetical protein